MANSSRSFQPWFAALLTLDYCSSFKPSVAGTHRTAWTLCEQALHKFNSHRRPKGRQLSLHARGMLYILQSHSPPQLRWINLTVAHKICPVFLYFSLTERSLAPTRFPWILQKGRSAGMAMWLQRTVFFDGLVEWWGTLVLQKSTTWQGKIICSTKLRMMQDHHAFLKAWFYAVFFTLQTQACRTWLFVWCLLSNFGSRLKCWRNASHQRNPASFYILQLPMPGNCQFTCSSQTSCFLSCWIDAFDSSSPWPTNSKQEE